MIFIKTINYFTSISKYRKRIFHFYKGFVLLNGISGKIESSAHKFELNYICEMNFSRRIFLKNIII